MSLQEAVIVDRLLEAHHTVHLFYLTGVHPNSKFDFFESRTLVGFPLHAGGVLRTGLTLTGC